MRSDMEVYHPPWALSNAFDNAQGYAEIICLGCVCGYAANTTQTISFVVVRRQVYRVLLQSPGLRPGNGKMARLLAAMPPTTWPFSPWRGAAAPIAAAKGDVASTLDNAQGGAVIVWVVVRRQAHRVLMQRPRRSPGTGKIMQSPCMNYPGGTRPCDARL
jgi:hypothetical protein